MDIMIKLDYDEYGDLSREVFIENYVQHVEGRYGKRGNIMCITVPVEERDKSITVPVEKRDKRFFMDSGSGRDLISARKVDRMDLST